MNVRRFEGVWAFSEDRRLLLGVLGKCKEVADKLRTELSAVLLGYGVKEDAHELVQYGADKVYVVDDPLLKEPPMAEPYVGALTELATRYKPNAILMASTKRGKEFAARLAARLKTGCAMDCTRLDVDERGRLLMERMMYGGNAISTEICLTKPQVATISPTALEWPKKEERRGEVVEVSLKLEEPKVDVVEVKGVEAPKARIEEAKVVVIGGRGVAKREDFAILEELAELLGGQVGYTRPLIEDRKWFTATWVGLSGVKIRPDLYIGCGVSGVIQHAAGIRDSKVIVAINTDPSAPIFEIADYIVVGDLYRIVPTLTDVLKKLKPA